MTRVPRDALASVLPQAAPSPEDTGQRAVALEGASNFRDLGGYVTADGRELRWRVLFRSDHLGNVTARDLDVLRRLGLSHRVDFRGADESASYPCAVDFIEPHPLRIEPTIARQVRDIAASGRAMTRSDATALMLAQYRGLVAEGAERFADLFERLLSARGPLVFHCTAGKDRTGLAAALVLHALGVAPDVVMADYLLTNTLYRRPTTLNPGIAPDVLDILWGVEPMYLQTALHVIDTEHGGLDRYLRERLRLGAAAREALRDQYLVARPGA